jgi:hypothetical protein
MKLKTIAILVVFLLAPIAVLAQTTTYTEPSVQITGEVLEETVVPGSSVTLQVTFTNTGTLPAEGLLYSVSTGTDLRGDIIGYVPLGSLGGGSSQTIAVPLQVDSTASIGTKSVRIQAKYHNSKDYAATATFAIPVESRIILNVEEITYDTELLEPGRDVNLFIKMRNAGDESIERVTASISAVDGYITPVLAGAEDYVPRISPNGVQTFNFALSIDSSAETKTYPTTLTLMYEDTSGRSHSDTFSIGLPISGKPNLQVLNSEIEDGEFQVELGNLGTAKAKAIRAELIQNGEVIDVDIDNELKADKHTTMRYDNFAPGVAEMHLTYVDDAGTSYESTASLSVEGVVAAGVPSSVIALLVIVLAEAAYIFKLRRERKKLLSE